MNDATIDNGISSPARNPAIGSGGGAQRAPVSARERERTGAAGSADERAHESGSESRGRRVDVRAQTTKVLHVITGDLYAGAERVQELLAERLPDYGYEASFACLKHGAFEQKLAAGPHENTSIAMRSRVDVLRSARQLVARARETGCRILHTHTARGVVVGSLASVLSGLPLVHHVHSPTVRDTDHRASDWLNACIERVSLLRAGAIIPVSESLARRLLDQGHARARIRTVHNGVAECAHTGIATLHPELRLGMVALFRARKGLDVLLRAMASLARRGIAVRLHAVGDFEHPEYRAQIMALAEELGVSGQIEWRGFRPDVAGELRAIDLLVLPSLYGEGMPMVVLEAMAAGLPIVASRVEGVPEAVRDGQEGLLVAPGDVEALSDALARVADDRPGVRSMGNAARCRQRALFSDRAMAERVSHIYDVLLDRSAPTAAAGVSAS